MNNIDQTITLRSSQHFGSRVPSQALGRVLEIIPNAVARSVRMAIEGRSRGKGKRPDWLRAATDVRFIGHDGADETVLHFEVPRLGQAAPNLYSQHELWPTKPVAEDTAFDILADVVVDVAARNADSERFDRPLLDCLVGFGPALRRWFTEVEIDGRRTSAVRAVVSSSVVEIARTLYSDTPLSQRVRIVGKLDMLRSSTQSFGVILDDGQEIRGVLTIGDIAHISPLMEQRVLVLGKAIYRPSGRLLRVDADAVVPSDEMSSFFSAVPKPVRKQFNLRETLHAQQHKNGLAAIMGKWPGDETDEEIERALRELS